jgi:hypothetical protein
MKKQKAKFTVLSKTLMVQLGIPVEVGQVKTVSVLQLSIYHSEGNGLEFDIDDIDYRGTTYMGMAVDGYHGFKKLREFHKEMGIDIDLLINQEVTRICPPEMISKWIEENITELMKK